MGFTNESLQLKPLQIDLSPQWDPNTLVYTRKKSSVTLKASKIHHHLARNSHRDEGHRDDATHFTNYKIHPFLLSLLTFRSESSFFLFRLISSFIIFAKSIFSLFIFLCLKLRVTHNLLVHLKMTHYLPTQPINACQYLIG